MVRGCGQLFGLLGLLAGLAACSGGNPAGMNLGYGLGESAQHEGHGALSVRWHRTLTPSKRGAYVPVETAVAAIDVYSGRLFIASVGGNLYALQPNGAELYRLRLGIAMESEPALDVARDELYLGNERAQLLALDASQGRIRWRATASGAVRRRPALTQDAVFVVTENDVVEAFSRKDGSVLWRYERELIDGFLMAGHAGLTLAGNALYTAFNDGAVVCLDVLDGRVRWEQDTSRDAPPVEPGLPQYLDVDTTPLVQGELVFVASFGAGLYALDAGNGGIRWRLPDWTGVVGVAAAPESVVVASADRGVARIDTATQKPRWVREVTRGTASAPIVSGTLVLYGESHGSFLALDLNTGDELSRLDTGHGFQAQPALGPGYGYVLSNGGTLLALRVRQ